uniref:Protein tyrosine phosphatase 4A2b n=1 Tax=Gasterosteus aculeatus aculeatus TaxID=481459 RepID=G3NWC7_GASAC
MGRLANMNRPAAVEIAYECMRFLITHNPTNATLNKFTEDLKKCDVNTLVRVCDATYDKTPVEKEGIQVLFMHIAEPMRILFFSFFVPGVHKNVGENHGSRDIV